MHEFIEVPFVCPYCWQRVSILVDSGISLFDGIEDCEVCCNPIEFRVVIEEGEVLSFDARKVL